MYRKYHGFHVFASSSQSKPAKTLVLTDNIQKKRCFETIFHNFSARAPPFKKNIIFYSIFASVFAFIRTQEGVKSEQIAKLHLNSTSCL